MMGWRDMSDAMREIMEPPASGPYLYWHWALWDAGLRIVTEFY